MSRLPKKLEKLNHTPQTQSSIGGLLQQSGNMHAEDSIQAVEDGIAMFFAPKKHTWNGETEKQLRMKSRSRRVEREMKILALLGDHAMIYQNHKIT